LDESSAQTVKRYFKEYYFRFGGRIRAPTNIESREFGYFPFGGAMVRHLSFKDIGSFRAILVKEAPAGVYCSNSLYHEPNAEMHLKGWIRAELIFDIDADALKLPCKKTHDIWLCKGCGKKEFGLRPETCPSCKSNRVLEMSWTCPVCLNGTKKETYRLLEILQADFGIPSSQTRIFFSGNAGYHLNIENSAYESLDTHGRAELADYLTGRGLLPSIFNSMQLSCDNPGWRGRVARCIRDSRVGEGPFKSEEFDKRLREFINVFSKAQSEKFLERVVSENAIRIDPMVTTDVHRIFRMPETLNNKTGLVKRECTENFDSFDPILDSIALKDEKEKVLLEVDLSPRIDLGGSSYGPFRSARVELPLYVAVYLLAKGAGKLIRLEPNNPKEAEAVADKLKAR
jgi:DNA primase small subunit